MCYCNCSYEEYPFGPNEGCVCRMPRGARCPLTHPEDALTEDDGDNLGPDSFGPEPEDMEASETEQRALAGRFENVTA